MSTIQRMAEFNRIRETSQQCRDFVSVAKAIMAHKSIQGAAYHVEKRGSLDVAGLRIADILQKAAVAPLGVAGADTGLESISLGFIGSLANASAFDRIAQRAVPLVLDANTVGTINSTITAYSVARGNLKPIGKLGALSTTFGIQKAHAALVMAQELVRSLLPSASAAIERELRQAVSLTTDTIFFSTMLSGVSGFTSTGQTAESVRADISSMLRSITTGDGSVLFLATTALVCKSWSMLTDLKGLSAFPDLTPLGGFINGIPVIVTDGLLTGQVVLLDASGIGASTGSVTLQNFDQGDIIPDSAPDSPPTASTSINSLWQLNKTAVVVERFFVGAKLRTDAVALCTNSNSYQGGNSPP